MSTPSTLGVTTITWGVPTLTGFVIQSYSTSQKTNVVGEVFDETGKRVAVRYDDLTTEITLDVYVTSGTAPTAGTVFTYNSVKYEVISVDVKGSNKGFVEVSIKGKTSEGITLT